MGVTCPENCNFDPRVCMIQGCHKSLEIITSLENENKQLTTLVAELEELVITQIKVINIIRNTKEELI